MIPYVAAFGLGFTARKLRLIGEKDGNTLLKIYFYFIFPFLVFRILHSVEIGPDQIVLPFIAFSILIALFAASLFVSKKLSKEKSKRVSFVLAVSIMNTGFIMPFVNEFAGETGLASLMIFDIGNMVVIATFLFAFSSYSATRSAGKTFKNILLSPPIWAIAVSALVNAFNIKSPEFVLNTAIFLEKPAFPLVLFALGSLLEFEISDIRNVSAAVAMRMIAGGILGLLILSLINLPSNERLVVILAATSPCGFNSVVYASLHGHDAKSAASTVSISLIISILVLPVLLFFFLK